MLTVRKRIIMNVCLLSLVILSHARNNAARIAPARNRDYVDGFQEINVGRKTSGVITPKKDLLKKKHQSFSSNFSVYIEQDTGWSCYCPSKVHAQIEKLTQKLGISRIADWSNNGSSHRLKPTWTAHAPYMIRTTDGMSPCWANDLHEYGSSR